jgi:hypothetical protein
MDWLEIEQHLRVKNRDVCIKIKKDNEIYGNYLNKMIFTLHNPSVANLGYHGNDKILNKSDFLSFTI